MPSPAGSAAPTVAPAEPAPVAGPPDAGAPDGAGERDALAPRLVPLLVGVLLVVVAGGTTDLVLDRPRTLWSVHVLVELAIIALSLGFAVVLWRGWWRAARDLARTRATLAATQRSLAERQAERDAWRRSAESAVADFGQAVDAQFQRWQLTPTEREVAFLLLQGHGHKQIAAHTGRSERTVRQHAVAVYQKAGLGGRAELAAFFLQDLGPGVPGGTGADAPPRAHPGPGLASDHR